MQKASQLPAFFVFPVKDFSFLYMNYRLFPKKPVTSTALISLDTLKKFP